MSVRVEPVLQALAEMLSNQSARDQSLASSLGQLRQEQVKEVDHDAPLLQRCIEEIEKLKVYSLAQSYSVYTV